MSLSYSAIEGPLAQFQHTLAEKADTKRLLAAVNKLVEKPLEEKQLEMLFEALWPRLEAKLDEIPKPTGTPTIAKRKPESMIEEILEIVRSLRRENLSGPWRQVKERRFTFDYESLISKLDPKTQAPFSFVFNCVECEAACISEALMLPPPNGSSVFAKCSKCAWSGKRSVEETTGVLYPVS